MVASGALLLMGLSEAYSEIEPYFVSGQSTEQRFLAIASSQYLPGRSLWSKDIYLRDCLDVSDTVFAKAQPTARRNGFLKACGAAAAKISETMLVYALPRLVEASTANALQDHARFETSLVASSVLGPNDLWAAERRVRLALSYKEGLSGPGAAALDRDIIALLQANGGARSLAAIYLTFDQHRQHITDLASGVPQAEQQAFLGQVRALAADRSN